MSIFGKIGKFIDSVSEPKEFKNLDKNDPQAFYNLGIENLRSSNFNLANMAFQKSKEIDPQIISDSLLGYTTAYNYMQIKEFNWAIQHFSSAITKAPDFADAYKMRAFTYVKYIHEGKKLTNQKVLQMIKKTYQDFQKYQEITNDFEFLSVIDDLKFFCGQDIMTQIDSLNSFGTICRLLPEPRINLNLF